MIGSLGRGGRGVVLDVERNCVVKEAEAAQPEFMRRNRRAFVDVLSSESVGNGLSRFTMPVLRQPLPVEIMGPRNAMMDGLGKLRWLWRYGEPSTPTPVYWRERLLARLLALRPPSQADGLRRLVESLPQPPAAGACVAVHGDATLANLLYDARRRMWVWCDPLPSRPYIPTDPLVDLGKMFQSCWGYERVLLGMQAGPGFDEPLARDLVAAAGPAISFDGAASWCYVHLVRLLPYQEPRVARLFEGVLSDVGL